MKKVAIPILLCFILAILIPAAYADDAEKSSIWRDPEDGAFDMTNWLLSQHGFLPMPIIVTEPAVDGGIGATVLYFWANEEKVAKGISLDITGGAFVYTFNGSIGGGVFHLGFWRDDTIRYRGALVRSNAYMDFFLSLPKEDYPVTTGFDSWAIVQDVAFRLDDSKYFLGPRWFMFLSDNTIVGAPIEPEDLDTNYSAQGVVFGWDDRDTVWTPSSGKKGELQVLFAIPVPLEDSTFWLVDARFTDYRPFTPKVVYGDRWSILTSFGDTPYYAKPGIDMRGVPKGRYSGDYVAQYEGEFRIALNSRWDIMALGGGGFTFTEARFLKDLRSEFIYSAGTGIRYQISRRMGISSGVDVAFSNEDWAIYFITGNKWH